MPTLSPPPAAPGGFIDDYRLDEGFRNDLGFLYCCHISDGVPAELEMVPTRIVHTWQVGGTAPAQGTARHARHGKRQWREEAPA